MVARAVAARGAAARVAEARVQREEVVAVVWRVWAAPVLAGRSAVESTTNRASDLPRHQVSDARGYIEVLLHLERHRLCSLL